jgi:hypothetical protein
MAGAASGRSTTDEDATLRAGESVLGSIYKGLRRFAERRIEGFVRLPGEHFSVLALRPATGESRVLATPWSRYFADPFLILRDGRHYLFLEEYDYVVRNGHISVCEVRSDLSATAPIKVLEDQNHLSYPFLFEQGGRLFMLPESSQNRTVDLYECVDFPHRWTHRRRLLSDVDAADTTLLEHEGRIFAFTSVREGASSRSRSLYIYSTHDLLEGTLVPHPVNSRHLYAHLPYTSGRGAGPFLRHGDSWLRPVQWSHGFYGQDLRLMRVLRLTPTEFAEEPFTGPHPLWDLVARHSPHHYSEAGGIAVLDTRDRWSYTQHLPLLGRRPRHPDPLPR